jgi:RIO-like serine/threonine protein kinase
MSQGDIHFPKLYKYGQDYIIRELISGVELDKYLDTHKLTSQIIIKIIELYESMIKVGYKRLDAAIFHVFVTPSHELKLIDTAKSMKKKTEIPNLLISGIEKAGFKQEIFDFLKDTRPDLYEKWRHYKKINYKKIS